MIKNYSNLTDFSPTSTNLKNKNKKTNVTIFLEMILCQKNYLIALVPLGKSLSGTTKRLRGLF